MGGAAYALVGKRHAHRYCRHLHTQLFGLGCGDVGAAGYACESESDSQAYTLAESLTSEKLGESF